MNEVTRNSTLMAVSPYSEHRIKNFTNRQFPSAGNRPTSCSKPAVRSVAIMKGIAASSAWIISNESDRETRMGTRFYQGRERRQEALVPEGDREKIQLSGWRRRARGKRPFGAGKLSPRLLSGRRPGMPMSGVGDSGRQRGHGKIDANDPKLPRCPT